MHRRDRTHHTAVTRTRLGYVWTCSCGHYDLRPVTARRSAAAGAHRHRAYMSHLRASAAVRA